MKVFFYASSNAQGSTTHLVRKSDLEFSSLPDSIQSAYSGVEGKEIEIDPENLNSRWWLCKELVDNLQSKGWDACAWARVNSKK